MPRRKKSSKTTVSKDKSASPSFAKGTSVSNAAQSPNGLASRQTVLAFPLNSSPNHVLDEAVRTQSCDVTPGSTSPESAASFLKEEETQRVVAEVPDMKEDLKRLTIIDKTIIGVEVCGKSPKPKKKKKKGKLGVNKKPLSPMKRERDSEVAEKPPSPLKRERAEVTEKLSTEVTGVPEKPEVVKVHHGTLDDFFGCPPQKVEETSKSGRGRPRRSKSASAASRKPKNDLEAFNLDRHFTVMRRSSRRDEKILKEMSEREIERRVVNNIEEGMKVHDFEEKGRGVVVTRRFDADEFVVEYAGNLVTDAEAKKLNAKYAADSSVGCYMFWIVHRGRKLCVDATAESGRFGRLINHSRTAGNLKPKVLEFNLKPRLCLFATRQIFPGEELLYDYGDRDKESMEEFPWLKT